MKIRQTFYVSQIPSAVEKALIAKGIKFTTRDVFSGFHGIEVEAEVKRGKQYQEVAAIFNK